jgi:hypothetical protein
MAAASCTDEEFVTLFQTYGAQGTAERLGIAIRNVLYRRRRIEEKFDRPITPPNRAGETAAPIGSKEIAYPSRAPFELKSGMLIAGSDAHYWPDEVSCGHRALVKLCEELQPKILVMNGDVIDGARISRHPPIGWSKKPTVKQELDTVEQRLSEIEDATRKATRIWTLGNHDMRFENRLAAQAGEFEGVEGFNLKDQFPRWNHVISAWVNTSCVIKHRFKGGIHATHNNTLWAGKTMVTGHLHSLKVTPLSDYNGIRWGVDTGTLADPYGAQFEYAEDNPLNHRSGLVVLTFHKGQLLWPEIARVLDDKSFEFRGRVFNV